MCQPAYVQVRGLARVTLAPLVDTLPCLGAVQISLLEEPYIDFSISLFGSLDLMLLPIFKDAVNFAAKKVSSLSSATQPNTGFRSNTGGVLMQREVMFWVCNPFSYFRAQAVVGSGTPSRVPHGVLAQLADRTLELSKAFASVGKCLEQLPTCCAGRNKSLPPAQIKVRSRGALTSVLAGPLTRQGHAQSYTA